jgi:hypothetical protein
MVWKINEQFSESTGGVLVLVYEKKKVKKKRTLQLEETDRLIYTDPPSQTV